MPRSPAAASAAMGPDVPHRPALRLRLQYHDLGAGEEASIGTATVNAYIDMPIDFVLKPYVGAGVGYGLDDAGRASTRTGWRRL